jgi:hypothetical protein
LPRQVARNWNREDVIRIHFGPVLDLTDQISKPDRVRSHKEIADFVMEKIAELGEQDRQLVANCQLPIGKLEPNTIGNRQSAIGNKKHVSSDR